METEPVREELQKPQGRFQFSLRDVFVLFLIVSVLLALVTQLKHVGFVTACFIVGMSIGWRLRNERIFVASLLAFLVFVVTYLACWVKIGYGPHMDRQPSVILHIQLQQINESLLQYAKTHGDYPDSLQALAQLKNPRLPFDNSGQLLDGWDHPFYYRKASNSFELASLGRDGKLGGVGLDADISLNDELLSLKTRLPMSQFLFETAGSGSVFFVALLASLVTARAWFIAQKDLKLAERGLIVSIVVTTVAAVAVAVFLATFHVAASQSGH